MSDVCAQVSLPAKTLRNDVNAANKYAFVLKVKTYSRVKERENYNLHKRQYQRDWGAELNNKTMSASDSSHWKVNNGNIFFFGMCFVRWHWQGKEKKMQSGNNQIPQYVPQKPISLIGYQSVKYQEKKAAREVKHFLCQSRPWTTVTWDSYMSNPNAVCSKVPRSVQLDKCEAEHV